MAESAEKILTLCAKLYKAYNKIMQKIAGENYIKVGKESIVVLPLKEWEKVRGEANEYKEKKKLGSNLKRFDDLARWGREFSKKRGITKKQILEDD